MEKESSEWQLQGQPTVLLTLAHIFHHFAPLLVRRWWGREGRMLIARASGAQMHETQYVTCQGSV